MTAHRDPDRLIRAFLMEGQTDLADPVYDAVRATIEHKRQRVVIVPWRTPDIMNKLLPLGLGAAAVVAVLVIGAQLLGPPAPGGVGGAPSAAPTPTPTPTPAPTPTPTPTPAPTPDATPSPTAAGGLPQGPFVITGDDGPIDGGPVQVTVNIASPGWFPYEEVDGATTADDGRDPPESAGAMLLAWAWPVGTGFNVYGDPCSWLSTIPAEPATTPDEIAAALATQASRDATAPVDVTVGGFAGQAITLHTPMSYYIDEDAPREEEFADCDQDVFVMYGIEGKDTEAARNAQGPGQIDELWILDVNGSIVILDASYGPATSTDVVDEMRALAESATFTTD